MAAARAGAAGRGGGNGMTATHTILRRNAARLLALGVIATLYGFARLPELSTNERAAIAARFHFSRFPLPTVSASGRTVRQVNPSLRGIAAWISSVGAAVALNDLDGDGLPNDV